MKIGMVLLLGYLFLSCVPDNRETPTSGTLHVVTAESVAPVIQQEAEEFMRLYTKAHITTDVSTSREAIVKLLNNEAKIIVTGRAFNEEERNAAQTYRMNIDSFKVAYDGIAVVVHEINPINRLTIEQLEKIFSGKIRTWKELSPKGNRSTKIFVALGGPNTSVYEFFKNRVLRGSPYTTEFFRCSTSTQVLNIVASHPESIGLVAISRLPKDESNVKVLEIANEEYQTDAIGTKVKFFSIHQANIYRGFYPLRRTIYLYAKDVGFGVGTGFISFVTSFAGQDIFKKAGLVPATMPVRLVHFSEQAQDR